MNSKGLEKKIKKCTKNKNYEESKQILIRYYIKHFTKMLKYKRVTIDKKWYFYDYIQKVKEAYSSLFSSDLEEMLEVMYENKYDVKYQINWLIDNYDVFKYYKL